MGPWSQILRLLRDANQVGLTENEFIERMPDVSQDLVRLLLGVGVKNGKLDLNADFYSLSIYYQERGCSAPQA